MRPEVWQLPCTQTNQETIMPNRRSNPSSNPNPRTSRSDRAQPGDVLGVETDGKRTHLGDDAEDENEELEDAEEEIDELHDEDE
jgi:hypothetical protein